MTKIAEENTEDDCDSDKIDILICKKAFQIINSKNYR